MNRETWLEAVADLMAPWFKELPPLRLAIGFPSTGKKGKRIGECWDGDSSEDGRFEILIRPDLADPMEVAAVLAHEMIHASVGLRAGHGRAFKAVAQRIGLEGKMTATVPGDAFKRAAIPILAKVGPLPHARLNFGQSSGPKKQTTRLVKACCSECGYTVRVTRKWLDDSGAPLCPKHMTSLVADIPDDDEEDDQGLLAADRAEQQKRLSDYDAAVAAAQ